MEGKKNLGRYYREIEKDIYKIKKIGRKASKLSKKSKEESKTELTEEQYRAVYEVIFFELGEITSRKFFNLINQLIEDRKKYSFLSEKHNTLVKEFPRIKEEMKKEILEEYSQKIINLENKINISQKETSELSKSKNDLKDIEKQFKEFIVRNHFKSRKELLSKPLDFILELFETTREIRAGKIIENPPEKKIELPQDLNSYLSGTLCACGSLKAKSSKGCSLCRLKADSGRKRDNQSMESSWKEVWNSFGYCPNEDMEMEDENN